MTNSSSFALHGREIARRALGHWLFSVTRYERGSSIAMHEHESSYATVVVRGGYDELSGSRSRECVAGSVVVHAAGDRHANRFAAPTTCLNVHGPAFDRSGVVPAAAATGIVRTLRAELERPDDFSAEIIDALMLQLKALSRREPVDSRAPVWLRQVRARIESAFVEPLSVSNLATEAGVHPTHLARSFREHYAMTVGEMVRERRVDHARRQLAAGASPSVVAAETGFADQSHFTRVFRRVTGVTPAAFAKSVLAR